MFTSDKLKAIKNQGAIVFKSNFLKDLTPIERYEFIQLCHRRKYNEGEFIYHQGDPGTGMYFIEEGTVELSIEDEKITNSDYTKDDDEFPRFLLEAPKSFGAFTMGYNLRRRSTAHCRTDCIILGFFNPDFDTLKSRHPHIAIKILDVLSMITLKQLDETTKALIEHSSEFDAFCQQFKSYHIDYAQDLDSE